METHIFIMCSASQNCQYLKILILQKISWHIYT